MSAHAENAKQIPWVVVHDPLADALPKEKYDADPRMYVVVSTTGRTAVAEPEYHHDRLISWWSPTGQTHIFADDVLAYRPLDVPDEVVRALAANPGARKSRMHKIMSGAD